MPLLSKVKDIFKGGSSIKKKKSYHNVHFDNPEESWATIGELGDGAYGKVYKAQHLVTGQFAALKQVILEGDDDLETFMVEIDILSECKHPNIVELLEAYHYDGKLWMYLEYCDGGAVDSIMVDLDRPLIESQIAYVCEALCNALSYIHSHKVIHRDLKAGNVLLTMDGGVKLADFGVSAKNKNSWDKRSTFIGTPYWLAPEVILCETFIDANYDFKADIWSLGIALIEFAQMDPPNHEVSPVRVMLKIQKSDPPKLDYPSRWSKEFNDFIAKCLTKNPDHRPSSDELLKHPFLLRDLDLKPIRELLLEYKAEVVEEDVDDDSEEQDHTRSSTVCNSSIYGNSNYDRESLMSVDKEGALLSDGEILPSPATVEELKEIIPLERRITKGPAPLPPPNVSHPLPPKKGPAPQIPSMASFDLTTIEPSSPTSSITNTPAGEPLEEISPSSIDVQNIPEDEVHTASPASQKFESVDSVVQEAETGAVSVHGPTKESSDERTVRYISVDNDDVALDNIDISSIPVPVTYSVLSPEACEDNYLLKPKPSDIHLTSVCTDGIITVRTPTPTDSGRNDLESQKRYSLSEAEAQAVLFLEAAIDSAMDASFKYLDDASSPSSLTEDEGNGEIVIIASGASIEGRGTGLSSSTSAHKLDQSEVLITNASILQDDNPPAEDESRPRFELTLEEVSEADSLPQFDETHISVIAVDDAGEKVPGIQNEDLNLLPLGGNGVSLNIEGTTIEASDVDNLEVEDNDKLASMPNAEMESKNQRLMEEEGCPLRIIQNGIRRASERSESDTTSTVGSDKENRQQTDDIKHTEAVQMRRGARNPQANQFVSDRNVDEKKEREERESLALRKKTRKRTRKFVIDGVTFTTTTSKVIYGDDEESHDVAAAHHARRQELRELKRVQRQEQKQFQELALKANLARQEQERKFENEKASLTRSYDSQIDSLMRQQKQLVEKAESRQETELKAISKKTRLDQEKELKSFKDSLKQEWKLLKQEVELLMKDNRKEIFKIRREHLEKDQLEREKVFVERLNECHELTLKRLSEKHRKRIALKERQFLEEKHQLLRTRESTIWDMEERQIQDKHQLAKEQLKDIYFLQRYQMAIRHNVEQEQVKRLNQQKEDNLLKRQQAEKRQLPKRIRQEMKTREKMFKEQMRISMATLSSQDQEKEQMRKFQEQEKIKYDKERKRAEMKHQKQLEEVQVSNDSSFRELVHLQNEKGKLLTEHETRKLKSLDEEYQKDLKEWKANLAPRKQKLEDGFERQLMEQEKFYGEYLDRGLGPTATPSHSSVSLTRSSAS